MRARSAFRSSNRSVAKIELDERLTLTDQDNKTYHPEAIIVASGASLRKLGVPGEEEFIGRGVSHCATCDGGFYRGQDVVVVGGGDSAAQEALVLAKTSRRVIMVCRSPLKAKRDYVDKIAARENVTFVWDSEVSAILGEDGVSGVRVRNVKDGTTLRHRVHGAVSVHRRVHRTRDFVPPIVADTDGTHQNELRVLQRLTLACSRSAPFAPTMAAMSSQAMAEGVGAAEAAARRS